MKIMYCITQSTWGGAQAQVFDLIKNQMARKNKVYLVTGQNGDLVERLKLLGLPQDCIFILPSMQRNISFKDVIAIIQLRNLIKRVSPDILHLHSSKAGIIGRVSSIFLRHKTIFTVHGWSYTDGIESKLRKRLFRFVEKMISPLTDMFICVSKYDYKIGIRDNVIDVDRNNAVVIHNGVNNDGSQKIIQTKFNRPLQIIMTARFSEQKDQMTLIKALYSIKNDNFEMKFIGDGETMKSCEQLVTELDLNHKVKFLGYQESVGEFLNDADIFVLSTMYEGLPISIIEAMSHSLPIIATNVGGNGELVQNNFNGYLTNGSVEDLSDKLDKMIHSHNLINYFGMNSYVIFEKDFKLNDKLNDVNNVYKSLVK